MEKHRESIVEKEFELERVSLFSDAVFAIAITLLVIDIKWPDIPDRLEGVLWDRVIGPVILSFVGFVLSFFFIGRFWTVHLRLFRLVRKYDQGLINRNLLFLFFIVTFPFTASGLFGHLRNDFVLPLYFYLGNLVLVSAANFNLCRYIFYVKPYLSVDGENAYKKYFYIRSKYTILAMIGMIVVVIIVALIFPNRMDFIGPSCAFGGIFLRIANRKAAKFKPAGLS
ncbi:TMEM175 family protein [Puia dinghuensis]|uniref:DUF1211 domain-containing protein n=1 Tax=Puia dinghuensis TaxID=1792502 RepID=A0A8J2UGD9_9BACT|nr:TMEM175 family protein [Puia dinghuensis]GGB13858.1 hypothetical protein GCM10011511_41990 [Puia dinghuensis]